MISPDDEADLRWYWTESGGDLGLRAIRYDSGGRRASGDASWEAIEAVHGRIEAVRRWRRVHAQLETMPLVARQALYMAYGMTERSLGVDGVLGLTKALQRRSKGKSMGEVLSAMRKDTTPLGRAAMAAMMLEADRILAEAMTAYARARAA